jgi:hypothetical protein
MPRLDPRTYTIQQTIEHELRPLLSSEAVEVLARVMASIIMRDPRLFLTLTEQFKTAFSTEYDYLQRQRTRRSEGAPHGY